jgi:hypothetical protein
MSEPRLNWLRILSAGLAALAISASIPAEEIAPGTHWTQPYFTRLDVAFPDGEFHARWEIDRCACGDVVIRSEETLPEEITTGEQLLVGGRVLLQRGYADGGPAMLDSPMLMLQLLFVLLHKAEPSGPAVVDTSIPVSEYDEISPISLDTGMAHGAFPAPWALKGELRRIEDGSHRFNLEFEFEAQKGASSTMHLSGELDFQPRPFPHPDEMKLEGWSVHLIQDGDAKNFTGQNPQTLAELREAIRKARAGD